ncbi:DMT family transporter [Corticicoccus populi]|uniref:DMT family transporter n=1 Tax=Corticicoccus populi TaxID=1812821 RepID=A0ABW5WWS8_9STAP
MNWIKIIIAAVFEVMWVIGITHSSEWWQWLLTLTAIYVSFYLLINASMYLPVGTSYAVFVGLGATGVALSDFILFDAEFTIGKGILIAVLLISVIGLKLVTRSGEPKGAE